MLSDLIRKRLSQLITSGPALRLGRRSCVVGRPDDRLGCAGEAARGRSRHPRRRAGHAWQGAGLAGVAAQPLLAGRIGDRRSRPLRRPPCVLPAAKTRVRSRRVPTRLDHHFWNLDRRALDTHRDGKLVANRLLHSNDTEALGFLASGAIPPAERRRPQRRRALPRLSPPWPATSRTTCAGADDRSCRPVQVEPPCVSVVPPDDGYVAACGHLDRLRRLLWHDLLN